MQTDGATEPGNGAIIATRLDRAVQRTAINVEPVSGFRDRQPFGWFGKVTTSTRKQAFNERTACGHGGLQKGNVPGWLENGPHQGAPRHTNIRQGEPGSHWVVCGSGCGDCVHSVLRARHPKSTDFAYHFLPHWVVGCGWCGWPRGWTVVGAAGQGGRRGWTGW